MYGSVSGGQPPDGGRADCTSVLGYAPQCRDGSFCHAAAGRDVSRSCSDSPGSPSHETATEVIHSSASWPSHHLRHTIAIPTSVGSDLAY